MLQHCRKSMGRTLMGSSACRQRPRRLLQGLRVAGWLLVQALVPSSAMTVQQGRCSGRAATAMKGECSLQAKHKGAGWFHSTQGRTLLKQCVYSAGPAVMRPTHHQQLGLCLAAALPDVAQPLCLTLLQRCAMSGLQPRQGQRVAEQRQRWSSMQSGCGLRQQAGPFQGQ